jgi:phage tail-like protein
MPSHRADPLLRVDNFQVLIGDREIGFSEVTPMTSVTDLESPGHQVHRLPPVVLRRALGTSTELFDWRQAIVSGKDDRRDVTVRQLSTSGGTVVNAWRLVGAWPSRWSGPAFDAIRAGIAHEEIELIYDDLVWLDRRSRNAGG